MDMKPGDIVILKSGGQPMTVAELKGSAVVCVWMGEEGDLFRETLPLAVLDPIEEWALEDDGDDEGEDENDDEEDDDDDDDDDDEEEDKEDEEMKDKGRKRK